MAVATILLLVVSLSLSSGYFIMDDDDTTEVLTLPSEYHLRAEMIDLIEDIHEPLELWFSAEYNRSRIDVRGGLVQRYYYFQGDNVNEGEVYTITSKSTDAGENELTCLQEQINEESRNHEAFPDDVFDYAGNKVHEGKQVYVWEYISESKKGRTEQYMYTYRTKTGDDVPVQLLKKYYNILKGTIETHKLFNYFEYNPLVSSDDLDAEKDSVCEVTQEDFQGSLRSLHPAFHGDLNVAFNRFKKHHNKMYGHDEHEMRKKIFEKNWKLVVEHNGQNLGYKLAMNHLSDRTPEERRRMNGARSSPHPAGSLPYPHSKEEADKLAEELPEEYDMRVEGFISPVKNQGSCGSCWTFATTAAVEGVLARLDGRILDLSEQTLVDCAWAKDSSGNSGCDGGLAPNALQFVMKHGLPLDEDYGGYLSLNGYCHLKNVSEVFKIRGYTLITPQSVNAMKLALVQHGPAVVYIQANDKFSLYSSGIFYDPTCIDGTINHAITIVGYGVRDGVEYWIVKNSYGESWGEDGYMLLSTADNNCYVLNESYYPVP